MKMQRETGKDSDGHSRIPDWPENERPRERLLKHGVEMLSDAELLAILIRTGARKRTAVDLARKILSDFETLERLASRSAADLRQQSRRLGLGLAKAASVVAAFELGRRALASPTTKTPIRSLRRSCIHGKCSAPPLQNLLRQSSSSTTIPAATLNRVLKTCR